MPGGGGRRDAAAALSMATPGRPAQQSAALPTDAPRQSVQQPAALLYGPGHRVVHANAAFVAEFGALPIGVPAVEALLDFPPIVLEVVERAVAERRALATWVVVRGERRRLAVAPRSDVETGEVYGVALRLARPED